MSVGAAPPTWATPSGSLDDARHRAGSNSRADGLKVQAAISGSENVVGAILFGTYWFARIVNELSAHPRLASLRSTTTVETDHPLLSFQLTDARHHARPSDTPAYAHAPHTSRENRSHPGDHAEPRQPATASSPTEPTRAPEAPGSASLTAASSPPTSPPCADSCAPAADAAPAPGTRRTG